MGSRRKKMTMIKRRAKSVRSRRMKIRRGKPMKEGRKRKRTATTTTRLGD